MDEREFDQFLKSRYSPKMSDHLTSRIITESKKQRQVRPSVAQPNKLREFFSGLLAPQPALVFGVFLLLAIALGVFNGDIVNLTDESDDIGDVSMAFYVDDIFGYEEYL